MKMKIQKYGQKKGLLFVWVLCLFATMLIGVFVLRDFLMEQIYKERTSQLNQVTLQLRATLNNALDSQWHILQTARNKLSWEGASLHTEDDAVGMVSYLERAMDLEQHDSFLMLLDENGNVLDKDGKHGIWVDVNQIRSDSAESTFLSESSLYDGVYWAFVTELAEPIPLSGDSHSITHLVLMKNIASIDKFYDSTAYKGKNETYILKSNGTRMYDNSTSDDTFKNYNIFKILRETDHLGGLTFDNVQKLLKENGTVSTNILYHHKEYYYSLTSLDRYGTILLFLIPAEYVAADTIEMVSTVMKMLVIFSLLLLVMMAVAVYLTGTLSSQRKLYALEQENLRRQEELNEQLKESNEALTQSVAATQHAFHVAAEANMAKSTFLSNMSHDIRTPMNAIIGLTAMLARDAGNSEKVLSYAKKITASSQHLMSLINDVLDMSKIESAKLTLNLNGFSLSDVVEEIGAIIRPQATANGQTFEIRSYDIQNELVIGDKLRLNQILINLLSNAVKYTGDGGTIQLSISQLSKGNGRQGSYRFVVEDNGMGMSEEFQKIVFDPFARENTNAVSKIPGTGLGMAIVKNLVDLMGGSISVSSRQGQGSAFTVDLEMRLQDVELDQDFWKRSEIARMLVVDDEPEVCAGIASAMAGTGVDISQTQDGYSAVEMTRNALLDHHGFDLILLDWKMPGLDGVETARRIRQIVPENVPVMILTAYDWSEIELEAIDAGISGFLPKPFFMTNFKETVDSILTNQETKTGGGPESSLAGKHFLIAEDVELNAEILLDILGERNATGETAENGKLAVELFERSPVGHFDAILMDVQMPVMNGYEATKAIRRLSHPQAKTIPILALTANAFAEDVREAMDAGMDAHIAKPINPVQLEQELHRILKSRESQEV